MRKLWKKMLELLLTVCVCVCMFSLVAGAQPLYPKTQYCYLNAKSGAATGTLVIRGISANDKITKTSVKSSAPSVVKLKSISCDVIYDEEATLGKNPISKAEYVKSYTIEMECRKPGTSKITFQVGKKKYTSTVRVLPYRNVVSSFTITGIKNGSSTNLAGKFAKSSSANVKLPKTQNNGKIFIKAASGWKITSIYYRGGGKNPVMTSERGISSITFFPGKMLQGELLRDIQFKVKNSKTGAEIEYRCDIG